jgi:glycosyltransferase involved in cell wall biosynthesis
MSLMPTPDAGRARSHLAIVTQDPRFGGGALAQLRAFLDGVTELGQDATLLYARRPPLHGSSPLADVPAVEVDSILSRLDSARVPLTSRHLARPLGDARSIWVVATMAHYGLAALQSGRPYGCWIGTTYDSEQTGRRAGLDGLRRLLGQVNGPALRRWERNVLAGASVLLAPTEQIAGELAAIARIDRDRVGVLPIPIDTTRFTPLADAEWVARPPRLVFVGRADDPRKNVNLLLDAFRLVRRAMPELTLRLVGRPPSGRLPDGVEALGEVRDVATHVRESRLLVLPSVQEGFGIAAAEALACGVPVVTTPCGGPEETVRDSGAGRVLQSFEPEELAHVTTELVADEPTLVTMRTAGRRHVVERYGFERFRTSLDMLMGALDRAA